MPAAGVTPDQIAGLVSFVHLLGGMLLACGLWIWLEGYWKRNGCPQCPHCRHEREERERKDREAAAKFYGLDAQSQATRERLFGRRVVDEPDEEVVAQPDPPASPGDDGDPGQSA